MDEQQMITTVNLSICLGPDHDSTTDIQDHNTEYMHISIGISIQIHIYIQPGLHSSR